ncbi:MAG TPA: hypothetical protein VM243_16830 [Phycisphaerae bacterium]|nr:hypothetical protein [Phycisphaerae bacterium]
MNLEDWNFARKHFVSISGWVVPRTGRGGDENQPPRAVHVSAFVLSVRGVWFLVTAGHVIEKLDRMLSADESTLEECHLIDQWAQGPYQSNWVPFDYEGAPRQIVGDETDFDYAVFLLEGNPRELLEKNGVASIAEEAWRNPAADAPAYFLLGIPAELSTTEVFHTAEGRMIRSRPSLILQGILPLAERPPGMEMREEQRAYGQIDLSAFHDDAGRMSSIEGVSGGPIFACKRRGDGNWAYWCVGVQSTWHRGTQTISWCPLEPLANRIDAILSDCDEEQGLNPRSS